MELSYINSLSLFARCKHFSQASFPPFLGRSDETSHTTIELAALRSLNLSSLLFVLSLHGTRHRATLTTIMAIPIDDGETTEKDIHELNASAVAVLKDVLITADSDDVKRKAAVDILNFSQIGKSKGRAPVVTEEQLEYLGRVIVEANEIHKSLPVG